MEGNDEESYDEGDDAADVHDGWAFNEVVEDFFVELAVDDDADADGQVSDRDDLEDLSV